MAYQPVFLLVWPNALFKAHWAIFIPDSTDKTCKQGKYLHVEGSLDKGFKLEIVRGWDISLSRHRPNSPIEIGWVRTDHVAETSAQQGVLTKDRTPRDRIEAIIAAVPAPSASLNSTTNEDPSVGTISP